MDHDDLLVSGVLPSIRLVRHAAGLLEVAPDFAGTEELRNIALSGRAGQKLELGQGLRAERSHRELRLTREPVATSRNPSAEPHSVEPTARYELVIPGEMVAEAFGLVVRVELADDALAAAEPTVQPQTAVLRFWEPGDRVTLRHSSGPRKVKEVLERMKVTGSERTTWPVLEFRNHIIWMRGVALQEEPGIRVEASPLGSSTLSGQGSSS